MSAVPDEADRHKAGTLARDPATGTKVVVDEVPRVHSVLDALKASSERALSTERVDGLTTGHYKLDKMTGKLRPAFAWLFGADTSWGKSSFLISLCDENIKRGKNCLIVSSEDAIETYGDRLLARRAGVNAMRLRDQRLEPDEIDRVCEVVSKGERKPFYVAAYAEEHEGREAAEGRPLENLLKDLQTLVREEKVDFVAFDYLQEFTTRRRYQDERIKFKAMAGMMRRFIRRLKISGMVFSQLTINSETKIPTRHNIRECRDVANGADVILLGFEPEAEVRDKNGGIVVEAGQKCIHVDKVKNGPRGAKVPMVWDEHSACFMTVKDPEQELIDRQSAEWDDFASDNSEDRHP